jgi:putative FmdB family regulatory protein
MPIYGYACSECGHQLDALQKIADDPLVDCPECNKPGLKRQLSAPRFRLKGGGWYETDFKTGDKRNLHADEKKVSKPKESGDAGKEATKTVAAKTTPSKASSA